MKAVFSFALFICLAMFTFPLFGQMRIIPHLTSPTGGFTTEVILTNRSETAQNYTFNPFRADGVPLTTVNGMLAPEETVVFETGTLFPDGEASHFTIDDNDQIEVTIAYQGADRMNSAAHIGESSAQSNRWRIYPGTLNDVIDGLAVVNMGSVPTEIFARQVDLNGNEISRVTIDVIAANAKALYLYQDFNKTPNTYFEVFADENLAIIALRFANGIPDARFFWSTAAVALPAIKDINEAPQIIDQVALTTTSGTDLILTLDHLTVVDPDNTYPDDFTLEVAAGENYSVSGTTITPNNNFEGTLQVPVAVNDGIDSSLPFLVSVQVTAPVTTHPRIGQKATFPPNSVYNIVGGQAVIVDERTIRLEQFTYGGQGPDVRIFLGMGGNYTNGFPISGTISGGTPYNNATLTFTLPEDKTLDDFDGISIWCTIFLQDFSSDLFK